MAANSQTMSGIANLLLLQQRLRAAPSVRETAAMVVNDTRLLVPHQSAVLWLHKKITAVSGLPEPTKHAPFTIWGGDLCRYAQASNSPKPQMLEATDLPVELSKGWEHYVPAYALWLPLIDPKGIVFGGLMLWREAPWTDQETRILTHWQEAVAYTLHVQSQRAQLWKPKPNKKIRNFLIAGVLAFVVGSMFLPVRLSVVAPGEVVPHAPTVIRAQIDGVVGEVYVQPNQHVNAGDRLIRLDDTALKARLAVVQQDFEIAQAERLRAEQAAVTDRRASSQIPMLNARIRKTAAEVNYVQSLLARVEIRADNEGTTIIPDAAELEGLPVKIGQRLMVLAEPGDGDLEIWLPVGDNLPLSIGADIDFFLNTSPIAPLNAVLHRMDYQAQISPDGILAFRLRATFDNTQTPPRIGWRGTAKVFGQTAPLYYYLFRRPFAFLRQWFGL